MLLLRVTTLLLIITVLVFSGTSLSAEKNRDDVFEGVVVVQLQMGEYIKKLPKIANVKMTREEMEFVTYAKFIFRLSINKSDHLYRVAYNMHSCRDDEVGCRALLFQRCVGLKEKIKGELTGYIQKIATYYGNSELTIISDNVEKIIDIENNLIKHVGKMCK